MLVQNLGKETPLNVFRYIYTLTYDMIQLVSWSKNNPKLQNMYLTNYILGMT